VPSRRAPNPADPDAKALARFGYAQQLRRRLGAFSSFAIGFSVISVLTGVTSTFGEALGAGGPGGLGLGWPLVSAGTMGVALAMAELASAFPTAGALYHWSALLGGPGWGWATAMLNLAGQVAITAAIDLACAQALGQLLGVGGAGTLGLFGAVVLVHAALNAGSVRAVAWLNDASAVVHVAGVVVLSALLLGARHHGVAFLASGIPSASGFVRALVLGVWTFTGFDAAAHVSEETHDPARRAPAGIVTAVGTSAVAGYALVAGLTLAVADPSPLAGQPDAALSVLRASLGDTAGRVAMGGVATAMWFAGLSSLTSASRMLFAFARDGGVPRAAWLAVVHPATATPVNATVTCAGGAAVLVMATARSDAAFLAVAALATIALYASYALPIALGAVARQRGRWTKPGPFHLGRLGVGVAWGAVAWAGFVFVVCALANGLAAGLFAGLLLGLGGLWVGRVRGRFAGPKVDLARFEER
jgi:amino acid transporter